MGNETINMSAVQTLSRQIEHRREIRHERLPSGRIRPNRWRGNSRRAEFPRRASRWRGGSRGSPRADDLERVKTQLGKFVLANAVAKRANQLIEARKSYWQPNGRGLLEKALLDVSDGRVRIVVSPRDTERSSEKREE